MASNQSVVYVACADTREIHCFHLDAGSGALTPFDTVMVPGGNEPSPSSLPMAMAPDKSAIFAALRTAPFPVTMFAIDRTNGRLTTRGTASLPAPMAYIATSAGGRVLMGASYKDGKISVSKIAPHGVDGPAAQVLTTPPKAHCIIAGRVDGIVYATSVTADAIMVFRLDAKTGLLDQAEPHLVACPPGSGPRHLALHPRLDVLYCVTELGGTLGVFAVDNKTGGLSELQFETLTPPGFTGSARAADLHISPDGRFAYASVRNTNSLVAFRIDPLSGRLSLIGRFESEGSPRSFAVDPQGRYLLCAGQTDNVVGVFAIDPDSGALTRRHRIPVAANPSWIEILSLPVA